MALAVEDAFADGGLRFIVPYVVVRLLGLALYARVTSDQAEQLSAVRVFAAASLVGMTVAVIGGFMNPAVRFWCWLFVIALDFAAALIGARREGWGLNAAHFTERHGLFVIIALGESLIAAGIVATTSSRGAALVALGSVAVVCLLWWSYFGWLKDRLEHAMATAKGSAQSRLARDAYSIIHFPLIAGVIGVAVGIEEMVAHPFEVLHGEAVVAFAGGIVLFVGSAAAACARALHRVLVSRLILMTLLVGAFLVIRHPTPVVALGVAVAVLLVLSIVEARGDGSR
jgi:low temperature requirement protein LtrA